MIDSSFSDLILRIEQDDSLSDIKFVPPSAWYGHGPFLKYILKQLKPRTFVELGTHFGFSYFVACEEVLRSCLSTNCYAVDTWQGDEHAGFFDESVYNFVSIKNETYGHFSTLLKMTFDEALGNFEDGSIDLLHIDGLHTYTAVKHDFESWLPKLTNDAVVLFHDINVMKDDFGVHKFWKELREEYSSFEFNHSYGLGVIFLNPQPLIQPISKLPFLSNEQRNLFVGAIGTRVAEFFRTLSLSNLELEESRTALIKCQENYNSLVNEFNALQIRFNEIEIEHIAKTAQLSIILESRSWKATKPLRLIRSRCIHIANLLKHK